MAYTYIYYVGGIYNNDSILHKINPLFKEVIMVTLKRDSYFQTNLQ